MKQYGFYFDASRCTGCKTCVVACKDKNDLTDGRSFRRVLEEAGGSWRQDRMTGAWHQDVFAYYVSVSCNHCSDPACTKVCPTQAHARHPELGGLVTIDPKLCIGCGACAFACPYDAPQYNKETKKMTKCDACVDRLVKGLKPACVEACPQRALDFGYVDELRAKYGDDGMIAPLADGALTRPNLVIRACKEAREAPVKTHGSMKSIVDHD